MLDGLSPVRQGRARLLLRKLRGAGAPLGYRTLIQRTEWSERSLRTYLTLLEEAGLVSRQEGATWSITENGKNALNPRKK